MLIFSLKEFVINYFLFIVLKEPSLHEHYSDNEEQNMPSCKELELDKDNEVSVTYNLIQFQLRFHLNRNHCDGFHLHKGIQRISL